MSAPTKICNAPCAETIAKLIPRLGSTFDGEVVATSRAIERTLRSAGFDWHDLAAAVGGTSKDHDIRDWRALVRFCIKHLDLLNPHEVAFLCNIAQWRGQPTERQIAWLLQIAEYVWSRSK
jgi:hypothetical protein